MPLPTSRRRVVRSSPVAAALAILVAALTGCSAAAPTGDAPARPERPAPTSSVRPSASPPGWDGRTGEIVLGRGPARVDVWLDPLCPYCKQFEQAQREALAAWSERDGVQLVVHPLTFLDRASEGTAYSTRAATVLATAAEQDQDAVLPLLLDLYERQPAEHSPGLTDDELADIAADHGVDAEDALDERPYDQLFAANSAAAFTGPGAITGTPAVRVDGTDVPSADLYGPSLRADVDRILNSRT